MSVIARIINDTNETHQLARDLVNGARSEILILFSAANGFKRILKAGNDQLLLAAAHRGVIVTILVPMDESMKNEAEKLEKQSANLSIRRIKPYSSSIIRPFTTFVVDKKHSLAMELKDDSMLRIEDAVGQAIYLTSKRTVEDSIFKFNIVLQLCQDENESVKRWLDDALKIVDDNKRGLN
jgi:two-component system sensor histidine kinase VicK